jgi:hypothetical protein
MERVQAAVSAIQEAGVPSLAPVDSALEVHLAGLAETSRIAPASSAREALTQLHVALQTLMPTEKNGNELVRLLDERAFDGLVADDGSLTRELAVETLIRLGYPWALRLHPDELSWFRSQRSDRARNFRLMILLGILGVEILTGVALYAFT